MAHVHFFLNPKGGTGKSLVSYIVAQYLISKGVKTTCIDCDPVTPTLIAYEALHAVRVNIMVENNIDKTKFDRFVELIAQGEENEHFVIDNGTSSFVPLLDYMVTNAITPLLVSMGHTVTFHVIIVGGDNLTGTVDGFKQIVTQCAPEARIIVWLNPFFGTIERGGKSFEDFGVYRENKTHVSAVLYYPDFPKDTFGKSFALLQKARLTFAEVCDEEQAPQDYDLMTRHRIGMIRQRVSTMLDAARVL